MVSKARLDLARAREPGDHNQLVARNLHVDVLEVVYARAMHRDGGARRGPGRLRTHRGSSSSSSPRWTNASSCTTTLLLFVNCTGVEALPINPWSARYSHAVVTPSTLKLRLK